MGGSMKGLAEEHSVEQLAALLLIIEAEEAEELRNLRGSVAYADAAALLPLPVIDLEMVVILEKTFRW